MKKCPVCSRTYDDSQSFCLMDGTALTVESETETIVRQPPAHKKSKVLPLILAFLVLAILSAGGIGAWLLYKYAGKNENAQTKPPKVNTKVSPNGSASPTPVSSPSATASPEAESSKETANSTDTDEVTPIDWDTSPGAFKGEEGQTYKLRCPADGTAHAIYGSDVYTIDSSICTAAVHAGIITLEDGGLVTVEIRPGRQIYGSTTRNGIKSSTWGPYDRSFVVR